VRSRSPDKQVVIELGVPPKTKTATGELTDLESMHVVKQSNKITTPNDNTSVSGPSENPTNLVADTETHQTVTFHDDKVTKTSSFPHFVDPDPRLRKSVQESRTHDIKDFLGRPSVIATGLLSTTQVQGDILYTVNFPDDLLALPLYREKTRGFLNFRATVNLKFQANAQRFQQGRLFIQYFPQADLNPKKWDVVYPSLTLSTQLPRVDFDLATDSDVALSIPYVSPTLGYNMIDGTGKMGRYTVRVYSPLVSPGGPATVDWSVWCWFSDIELDFPAFTAQSSRPSKRRGQMSRLSAQEEEAAVANNGPISGLFSRTTRAANLFKDVPLISSMANNVSWVSSILGNTAAAFGWSNPIAQNNVHFSKLNVAHDLANVNAISAHTNLGLLSDNAVQSLPGFGGTDVDEMSFNYLSSIPCYVDQFTVGTSQTSGTLVFSKQLSPLSFVTYSPSSPSTMWPSPMAYISNFFQYWRSGFVLTFKFVKTEFHSGRYIVSFSPGRGTADLFASTSYLYREVIDLRESNEFTITIPYTATVPYKDVNEIIGIAAVYVLNPLVAPTTVSPNVVCLVEAATDDSFEVAVPRTNWYQPFMYTPGTGAPSGEPGDDEIFEAQALGEDIQAQEKGATTQRPAPSIAGLSNNDGGLAPAAYCIGEKITSFRALAKRSAPFWFRGAAGTETTLTIRPKIVSLKSATDNTTVPIQMGIDYISMIAVLFNYQRGGLKFTAYGPNDYLRAALAPNTLGTAPVVLFTPTSENTYNMNPYAIATGPTIAGGITVVVPQYSRTQCEMYRFYTAATYPLPTDSYCSDLRLFIRGTVPLAQFFLLRQAADDWSCGFFTGCIPLDTANQGTQSVAGKF